MHVELFTCGRCQGRLSRGSFSPSEFDRRTMRCNQCQSNRKMELRLSDPDRYALQIMFLNARYRARKYGVPYTLTIDDLPEIPEYCPAIGIKIRHTIGRRVGISDQSPSLDRIDPLKGYVKDNLSIISVKANRIKNNATADELRRIALYVDREQNGGHDTTV